MLSYSIRFFLTWCMLLCILSSSKAQHIQVNLVIPPPYPIHLENYMSFNNHTVITLQNTSNQTRQIKLIVSVEGDNGITAAMKPTFTPAMPIVLNPMETKIISGAQLRAINSNLTESQIDVSGMSASVLYQTESLPEGSYTVCIEPLDFQTSVSYASPAGLGCTNIFLTHYDTPEIIIPSFEQEVTATVPQFVNFAWTPSGLASNTRYRFELVDMQFNNLLNINDAFANPSVQMHYTQSNILTPNLQYDLSKPPLITGRQYAVRVVAYDPSQQTVFKNNGEGPVSTFYYLPNNVVPGIINDGPIIIGSGNPGPGINPVVVPWNINIFKIPDPPGEDPPLDLGDCVANCALPAPGGAPSSIKQNIPVNIGFFQMDITQLNGNNGEGKIFIDFLKTNVNVVFSNLQVNADNTMLSGQVHAKLDPNSVVSPNATTNENANLETLYSQLPQILNEVQSNAKKVSMLLGQQSQVNVPFSLDNKGFDMVIVGLIFTPTRAYMNTVMGIETLTNTLSPYLGLSQSGIGIRPNGFCEDAELAIGLTADRDVMIVNNGPQSWIKTTFKGNNKTRLTYTCSGAHEIILDADLIFGRDILLPVNQQGTEQNGHVIVEIKTTLQQNLKEWYIESPIMKPSKYFTLASLKGFIMEANNIVYDQHGSFTPQGMIFHPQHPSAGGNASLWKGLYIGGLSIQFPQGFNKDGQPLKVQVDNMLLDKTGLWGSVSVQNILSIQSGDLGGWAFSIEEFNLDLQESQIVSGGFTGNIELPITNLGVPYAIQLAGQQGNEYSFGISPNTEIAVNMWIAKMVIGTSSSIDITKVGNNFVPSANLNAALTIGWNKSDIENNANKPSISKFQLPTLAVEGMKIVTQNGMPKIEKFGLPAIENLNLPQGEFLAFKINLTDLKIVNDQEGQNGLQLSLSLGFDNSAQGGDALIGGSTSLTFYPIIENKKFKFDKTKVNSVSINATVGPAQLNGGIDLYSADDTFGEGFRGFIEVKMPPLGLEEMKFTLQVGTAPSNYRYWMFDASIKLVSGIPCGPGISLYGFGGGFWYNMTRQGPENKEGEVAVNYNDMVNVESVDMTPGSTTNGITYLPSQGTFGFKANVIMGLSGASAAFNADVGFAMELQSDFSFNYIEFYGIGYLMQDMSNRGEALVTGSVHIKVTGKNIDPNGPVLTGDIGISMNVNTLVDVEANLNLSFMFSGSDWYVNFGSWDGNYEPKNDPKRNRLAIQIPLINAAAQFNCYFMIGTMVPANLPPLPSSVANLFGITGNIKPGAMTQINNGLAFAAGAGLALDINLKWAILYADINFEMGMDAIVFKFDGECGNNSNPGIGGWYAKGQAYAYLHVEGGLEIDLWFFSGKAPFIAFTAGALMDVQGPNPMWIKGRVKFQVSILGGLVKVNTQIMAEVGEKCEEGLGNPFDDIPIVSYVDPADKDKAVDCYTTPQIVFNFPDKPFIYEVMDDKDPDKVIYKGYSIKMNSYKFTYVDKKTNQTKTLPMKAPNYAKDGYSCLIFKEEIFPGLTEITYEIVTQGFEHTMNGYAITNNIKEAFPVQITKGTFTTDTFPDYISVHDIIYSVPGLGQRYFLKNDQAQGSIQLNEMSCDSLFKSDDPAFPNMHYQYLARFIELATNKSFEVPCFCNNNLITYAIPPELKLSMMYQLDFVRQTHPNQSEVSEAKSKDHWRKLGDWGDGNILIPDILANPGNNQGGGGGMQGNQQIVLPPQNPNPNIQQGLIMLPPGQQGNNINNTPQNIMINPNNIPNNNNIQANVNTPPNNFPPGDMGLNFQNKPNQKMLAMEAYDREFVESVITITITEKVIFTNYFKNSKYPTKSDKLAKMTPHNQVYSTLYPIVPAHFEGEGGHMNEEEYQVQVPVMLIQSDEGLDVYDVKGYFWSITSKENLCFQQNEEQLYNIHPPIFKLEKGYNTSWIEQPYSNPNNHNSIFALPDEQNFMYVMDIYDPSGDEPFKKVPYQYYSEGDLRQFLFWPDNSDWDPYFPTYFNDELIELQNYNNELFWKGDRLGELAFFDHINKFNTSKYRYPFMVPDFHECVKKHIPRPQQLGMFGEESGYMPAEWYSVSRHGQVNFGNKQIMKIQGHLLKWEIDKEKAKAPQQGGGGSMGLQNLQANVPSPPGNNFGGSTQLNSNIPTYIAVIDFSEWLVKKDHIRMTNKVLFDFREDCCMNCGYDLVKLKNIKDDGWKQYGEPSQNPKDQGFNPGNPEGIPPVNWQDARYTFKYLPMRAWLLHERPYQARPPGNYDIKLGNKTFTFDLPSYSQNATWPYEYLK